MPSLVIEQLDTEEAIASNPPSTLAASLATAQTNSADPKPTANDPKTLYAEPRRNGDPKTQAPGTQASSNTTTMATATVATITRPTDKTQATATQDPPSLSQAATPPVQKQHIPLIEHALIEHASRCKNAQCSSSNCAKMKDYLQHARVCKVSCRGKS